MDFDSYFGIPYSDDMTHDRGRNLTRLEGNRWPPLPLMENEEVIEAPVDRNLLTKRYTERALEFIEAHQDRPFFLLLSHAMPGSERAPFASEAFRGQSRNGAWGRRGRRTRLVDRTNPRQARRCWPGRSHARALDIG